MSRLPLSLLQHFVAVARQGNLSRAAAQAHLTVSALSHQIRQLEQRLERRLFIRGPRGVQLTGEGRRLLEAVGQHFDALEQALQHYRGRHEQALTISTLPGVMSSWLVPRLPRLVAAHPELELNLQSGVGLVDFAREPVDAALRYGRGDWPGLHSERLFDEWIAPVVAPSLVQRLAALDPGELAAWPLLGDPSDRWRDWFARFGGQPPRRYVAQFDSTDAQQRAALEGMGVALGRMVMARPLIEAGLLVVLGTRYLHRGLLLGLPAAFGQSSRTGAVARLAARRGRRSLAPAAGPDRLGGARRDGGLRRLIRAARVPSRAANRHHVRLHHRDAASMRNTA